MLRNNFWNSFYMIKQHEQDELLTSEGISEAEVDSHDLSSLHVPDDTVVC